MTDTGLVTTAVAGESPSTSDIVNGAFGDLFSHPVFGLLAIIGLATAILFVIMLSVPRFGDAIRGNIYDAGHDTAAQNEKP